MITIEENFGIRNVTIVLEWAKEEHVQYNITTFPHVSMWYIRETAVQLTVPYNIRHIVSVVATLCDHKMTNVTKLHYGELIMAGKNHCYRFLLTLILQLSVKVLQTYHLLVLQY